MANDTSGNPFYIDTAEAVTTRSVTIQGIAWVGNDTAGDDIAAEDDFELTDKNGLILFSKRAIAGGDDAFVSFPFGLTVSGITCTAIDGGVAYIYIR